VILIFQPIPKPAVNDLPLVANLTEIEKVRPFFLQVSEEEKADPPLTQSKAAEQC
jgi:hypothetical protein